MQRPETPSQVSVSPCWSSAPRTTQRPGGLRPVPTILLGRHTAALTSYGIVELCRRGTGLPTPELRRHDANDVDASRRRLFSDRTP